MRPWTLAASVMVAAVSLQPVHRAEAQPARTRNCERLVAGDGLQLGDADLDRLVECGPNGGALLGRMIRRAATIADPGELGPLAKAALLVTDSAVLRSALVLAGDSAATPAARVFSLFVALTQIEPRADFAEGVGFGAVLSEDREAPCGLRCRKRNPVAADQAPPRLTTRQREVLQLIGDGHGSAAIALRLGISVATVSIHRARVREVLGLRTEWELIRCAIVGCLE